MEKEVEVSFIRDQEAFNEKLTQEEVVSLESLTLDCEGFIVYCKVTSLLNLERDQLFI